jgi:hypothetical protein
MPHINHGMDHCFWESEVWSVIKEIVPDKAPDLDGFTYRFYQSAWTVIKRNIMQVFAALWSLDTLSLYLLNQAYMILLRKKPDAEEIRDFRPISLIHSFGKLFTKVLATRLAPHMASLVLPNRSAFIRGRVIHDNFRSVQSSIKLLHVRKTPCILLKVVITKAFDTMNWLFLLSLLRHLGFSQRWTKWISLVLSSTSTKIILNGMPGRHICHKRELHQGDLLSPLLFVLAMEVLNALFRCAEE